MLVSCALSVTLAIIAPTASLTTVQALRLGNFYSGGVANVVPLGLFVLAASATLGRGGFVGAPARWFGYVAGTLAVLSVLSLTFYYANVFLPVGRILSMAWTVAVATILFRRRPDRGISSPTGVGVRRPG